MENEYLEKYHRGLELHDKLHEVWNTLYDKGLKRGVRREIIDNTELWYFKEAVRRGDFDFFLDYLGDGSGYSKIEWENLISQYDIYVDEAKYPNTNYGFELIKKWF